MSDISTRSAILFLVFNRPETTRKVFETIRKAQPARLYIAADGPRVNKPDEAARCEEVRKIVSNVGWNCETKTLFREANLGCRSAVNEAISWFFQQELEGIILEDDCLPDPSFFRYCDELLETYRDDSRIVQISGDNFQRGNKRTSDSYYFSRYNHIWGWATWRRAWKDYDKDMSKWGRAKEDRLLYRIGNGQKSFENFWNRRFELVARRSIDTWDYAWTFSCWVQGGLTIIPEVNLVENIGFGEGATHTGGRASGKNAPPSAFKICFPLRHPVFVARDIIADRYTEMHHYGIRSIFRRYLFIPLRIAGRLRRMVARK